MQEPDDLWEDLWSFRLMITPIAIRWLFGIGLLVIPIVMGGVFVGGSQSSEAPGRFVMGAFLSLFLLPFWRVACELAMVAFSIDEWLGLIAQEGIKGYKTDTNAKTNRPAPPPTNPNLVPCPECGHYVSRLAKACPKCGHPVGLPPERPSGPGGS